MQKLVGSQLPSARFCYFATLASLLAIIVVCVVMMAGSGPSYEAIQLTTLALLGVFSILGLRSSLVLRRRTTDLVRGRKHAISWLSAKLRQPSEKTRVAALALSVDIPETVSGTSKAHDFPIVLEEIGRRMSSAIRQEDLITQGDVTDFLVCLARVRAPQAESLSQVARRLRKVVEVPIKNATGQVQPRLTIGMASSRILAGTTAEGLLNAAEDAHELALMHEPGTQRIHGAPDPKPIADAALVTEVTEALENGQITAWYQPQVSMETGQISGFEALARWEHPTRGVVAPASFLPLIEKAELTSRLARVILTHALSALRTWDRAGLKVPGVGVNLSENELRDHSLADYLQWELDRYDLSPDRLVIEVLESVIAESYDDAIATNLRRIAGMGCRIDLDDFGTGFTSIINIRRFDVSRIKIDRKLITGAGTDANQRTLIAALLAMADHLEVETLGEGVETQEEQLALAQLGCSHIQGYAIARPMPLGDTLTWSAAHNAEMAEAHSLALRPSTNRNPISG